MHFGLSRHGYIGPDSPVCGPQALYYEIVAPWPRCTDHWTRFICNQMSMKSTEVREERAEANVQARALTCSFNTLSSLHCATRIVARPGKSKTLFGHSAGGLASFAVRVSQRL